MINCAQVQKILYGGDYNPEQWPEDIWQADMRLFKLAHIDTVTLNVFSWAALQPGENTYDFTKLDRIMAYVKENGLKVCLATSTAVHPAWMAKQYPEVLRTELNGMPRKFGSRHNSCPNSPVYRKYSALLAQKLAERYRGYDNIVAWHISNEYGGACYCENCAKAFRVWLKARYQTLDALNVAWCTAFWGHTFTDWDEIVPPNLLSEHFYFCGQERTTFQGISLDYARFNSDSMMDCYRLEYDAIKAITPGIAVTTNFMGFYKPLDYQRWSKYLDFASWDNYPAPGDSPAHIALWHDVIRGLKGGMPFALMEQTPSVTNWQPYNALKRPGVMRLLSYQAVAHGADTVLFFQMRRSVGACEKYHGAVIDHVGTENTRVFREVAALGAELERLGNVTLGARSPAKVAMLFDWNNWWAIEYSAGPSSELKYPNEFCRFYEALHRHNIPVDIIGVEDALDDYAVVIAPVLYMVKQGYDEVLKAYVKAGGVFVTTFFSGYVNDSDRVYVGGYPGRLRELMGVWVEETDALAPAQQNEMSYGGKPYPARILCDLLHPEGAEVLATYTKDFYTGTPALTKNAYGAGQAYYVATASSEAFYEDFLGGLCRQYGIESVLVTPQGVEATRRTNSSGDTVFLLNHTDCAQDVLLDAPCTDLLTGNTYRAGETLTLPPKDVAMLALQN